MKENKSSASGGIGFCGLLGIVFIVLRLTGIIDWPWIWVLDPIWIPIAIGLLIALVFLVWWLILKSWVKS